MTKYRAFYMGLSLVLLGFSAPIHAQAIRVGAKVLEFELVGTDGKRYGLKEGIDQISILLFIGFN